MSWEFFRRTVRWSLLVAVSTPFVFADNVINVLWYTAATTDGGSFASYEAGVQDLAANASSSPDGRAWNVTFWDLTDTPPGAYDVMVVASPQFIDGADYSALNARFPTFGDRVLITGLDADWHYMNTPGPGSFDGPQGLLTNAIDWAAGGNGMGAVFLAPQTNVAWNFTGLGNEVSYDNLDNITIASNTGSLPLNSGLSSAGLSNWATSGKEAWDSYDSNQWTALQVDGDNPTHAVTLASAGTVTQGFSATTTPTPEPSTAMLILAAPIAIWMLRKRR